MVAMLVVVCACLAVERAAVVANFSGTWQLDREQSRGPSLATAPTAVEIRQRGDEFKFVYFSGEKSTGSENFLADATERERYTTRLEKAYVRVRWDKGELLITTQHVLDARGYQTYSETDSWAVSQDRKTLTNKLSDGTVLVYERQAALDPENQLPVDVLEEVKPFHATGVITGGGPCHGASFAGTLRGELIGRGSMVFCGDPPPNWGGKAGSCATQTGLLTFTKGGEGSSFKMTVIGQFCISDSGNTFRGTYEVDKNTVTGYFLDHIKGGSGEMEYSDTSSTVFLNGILLYD
jgi:hypothetical protein